MLFNFRVVSKSRSFTPSKVLHECWITRRRCVGLHEYYAGVFGIAKSVELHAKYIFWFAIAKNWMVIPKFKQDRKQPFTPFCSLWCVWKSSTSWRLSWIPDSRTISKQRTFRTGHLDCSACYDCIWILQSETRTETKRVSVSLLLMMHCSLS